MAGSAALEQFSPAVRAWFETSFPAPTPPQEQGWPAIAGGDHTLILAPTGSGKTLAAFLWAIDRLTSSPPPEERTHRTRVLYLSPLRALAVDVEKNLRAPIQGIRLAADRLGLDYHEPVVGLRTGDTPADERRRLVRHPPDILITTPESLYLLLTSAARETLQGVEAVIIDEIHSVARTKRGSHLALSLERLVEWITANGGTPPQRIGLSATQRPLEEIAAFLGGKRDGSWNPVSIVDAGVRKELDVEVVVPVDDMGELGQVIEEPVSGPAAVGPGAPQHLALDAPPPAGAGAAAQLDPHLRQRPAPGRAAGHPAQRTGPRRGRRRRRRHGHRPCAVCAGKGRGWT